MDIVGSRNGVPLPVSKENTAEYVSQWLIVAIGECDEEVMTKLESRE